ncbi:hypothetical protein [Rhodococcus sp. 27YEA15]|uniref:hypothetical protein n=1 Tax=Rhodococcus sp. 27YEA15 TaxID=3156259 RepID=UPI003C7B38C4
MAAVIGGTLALFLLILDALVASSNAEVIPAPIRIVLVVAGMTVLPGLPVVTALRISSRSLSAGLTIALSFAITILLGQVSMMVESWYPLRNQAILAGVSLALSIAVYLRAPWTRRTPRGRAPIAGNTRRFRALASAVLVASLALFAVATSTLDYSAAGHFGIIGEIGAPYYLGITLVAGVVVAALTRKHLDHAVMTAATLVMITYTTLLVTVASGQTSVPTAFVHRGFIATLTQAGALPSGVDARFSWAGFFSAGAHLVESADILDAGPLLAWAPLFFGAVLLFPLYSIAISITGNVRMAWFAIVLYQLFNWYQQDYFAPQAVALMFYSTIIATLLWQLRRTPVPTIAPGILAFVLTAPRRTPGLVDGFGKIRTQVLGAILLVLIVANTVTHQITPILAIIALAFFSLFGVTRYRTLWLAAGLIFAAWFSYGATDFWIGHLKSIFSEVGQVGASVGRGVGDRLSGDPTYQRMQYLRIGASGVFVLTAFVGWILARGRKTWLVAGAVSAAPFSLVALQSYGGEMIIRCFVLASPVLAPFAAVALTHLVFRVHRTTAGLPRRILTRGPSWAFAAGATITLVLISLVLTTNRGLNTAFEASTDDQVAVSDRFVADMPPNTTVQAWSHAPHTISARRILDPTGPRMQFIDSYPCLNNLSACALDRSPDYIYITSQGLGMLRFQYGMAPEYLQDQIDAIEASGRYVPMTDLPSITILRRIDSPALQLEAP